MRLLLSLFILSMLFSCNDDDGIGELTPDGFFDCENIAEGWTAQSDIFGAFHYPQDITFRTLEDAIAVSRSGQIAQSSDGGKAWSVIESFWNGTVVNYDATTYVRLWAVQAINEDLIYAAGEDEDGLRNNVEVETDAVFLSSFDGGQTWNKRYAGGISGITDIRFLDVDQGYALGRPNEMPADQRIWLFATEDGGDSWDPVELSYNRLAAPYFINRPGAISHIVETSELDVFALLTLDPINQSWVETPLPDHVGRNVQFVTHDFGFATTNEDLWITEDGGVSWTLKDQEVINSHTLLYPADEENWLAINRVTRTESGNGEAWEVLLYYAVSETKDGGLSWKTRKVSKDCDYIHPFNGRVERTMNNGFLSVTSRANLIKLGR